MLTGKLRWLPLTFCLLGVMAHAQDRKLEPGNPVEREIAGGESHTLSNQSRGGAVRTLPPRAAGD